MASLVRPRTQKEHLGSKDSTDGSTSVQDAVETDDLEETGATVTSTSTRKPGRRRTTTRSSVAPQSHSDLNNEPASKDDEERKKGAAEQRRAFSEQAVNDKKVAASLNTVPEVRSDPGKEPCESHDTVFTSCL